MLVLAGAGIVVLVAGGGSDRGSGDGLLAPQDRALGAPQDSLGPLPAPPPGRGAVDLSRPSLLATVQLAVPPKAGLAFDLTDGRLLWRRGATRVRPIASLTKLMTALLTVERLRPEDRVRVPRAADQVRCSCMGGLKPGRRVKAETLLQGLLISSGNDAAVTLAQAAEGSQEAFVALMNRRARQLGLGCTRYVDPHGLDARNRSCARDLAALTMRVMAQPRIARIAGMRFARVWPGAGRRRTLRTTNPLLRARYPGAVGLKTGFTNTAGRCLVAVVSRGGKRMGIVLLGDRNPGEDARALARAAVRAGVLPRAA